jgi:hypothetical protein
MIEAGAPPRYVQRQLGHGSARLMLEVYTRVSDSQDRATLGRAFDDLMAGAVPAEARTATGYRLPTISDTNPTPDSTTVDDVGGER